MKSKCSGFKCLSRALSAATGITAVALVCLSSPAWGQWTSGTSGSIYYLNGNVGIGTPAPTASLDIVSPPGSAAPQLRVRPAGIASSQTSVPSLVDFWSTFDNYAADQGPRRTASIKARYSTGVWGNELLAFHVGGSNDAAVEPIERMRITAAGKVGIGTTNPQYQLAVNGTVGAKEVIVTNTGWSDYVFAPGYQLQPLSEVSAFIQANGHLPGIPGEAEVREKGVSLGDIQSRLLAKVEELTLHLIQQDKENKELRERVSQLEKNRAEANSAVPLSGR